METTDPARPLCYFPAIVCHEYDTPIDALLALCVPRDEVMDLVVASWFAAGAAASIVTRVDGGRPVAALRTPGGRWAACNAFLDGCCATRQEAERLLQKRLKRGRRGLVGVLGVQGVLAVDEKKPAR